MSRSSRFDTESPYVKGSYQQHIKLYSKILGIPYDKANPHHFTLDEMERLWPLLKANVAARPTAATKIAYMGTFGVILKKAISHNDDDALPVTPASEARMQAMIDDFDALQKTHQALKTVQNAAKKRAQPPSPNEPEAPEPEANAEANEPEVEAKDDLPDDFLDVPVRGASPALEEWMPLTKPVDLATFNTMEQWLMGWYGMWLQRPDVVNTPKAKWWHVRLVAIGIAVLTPARRTRPDADVEFTDARDETKTCLWQEGETWKMYISPGGDKVERANTTKEVIFSPPDTPVPKLLQQLLEYTKRVLTNSDGTRRRWVLPFVAKVHSEYEIKLDQPLAQETEFSKANHPLTKTVSNTAYRKLLGSFSVRDIPMRINDVRRAWSTWIWRAPVPGEITRDEAYIRWAATLMRHSITMSMFQYNRWDFYTNQVTVSQRRKWNKLASLIRNGDAVDDIEDAMPYWEKAPDQEDYEKYEKDLQPEYGDFGHSGPESDPEPEHESGPESDPEPEPEHEFVLGKRKRDVQEGMDRKRFVYAQQLEAEKQYKLTQFDLNCEWYDIEVDYPNLPDFT